MENNKNFNNNEINNNNYNNMNNNGNNEVNNNSSEFNNNKSSDLMFGILVLLFSVVVSYLSQSFLLFVFLMILAFFSKKNFFKAIGKILLFFAIVGVIGVGVCIFLVSGLS